MKLQVLVIIDELLPDFSGDNTVFLMQEALRRGHSVALCYPTDISLNCGVPYVYSRVVHSISTNISLDKSSIVPVEDFDLVLMRQDPPFNMRYITITYILENCNNVIINDPCSVRNHPEKLTRIMKGLTLPTLVSENEYTIREFYNSYKNVVMKPIYSFGGRDVVHLRDYDVGKVEHLLRTYQCPIVVQQFCNAASDTRIILLDGEVLGGFTRIAKEGEFRANLCQGGTAVAMECSDKEIEICKKIGSKLKAEGLILVGLDILSGYITEINVTSPMGLMDMEEIYGIDFKGKCWDCFEEKVDVTIRSA